MSNGSSIEWTEATWNPTTGCSKISSGCKNCYAEKLSKRLNAMGVKKYENDFQFTEQPQDLELPLTWKKSKKVFVNSMSDLFHEEARMEYIGNCFNTMLKADHHFYQVLTKRPETMAEFSIIFENYFGDIIPPHIWMGTSVENEEVSWRIDALRQVKCHTRFLSVEPLFGSMGKMDLTDIDWVIIGGESGAKFRPVKKEWILDVIKQCKKQKVAVFFKQWGGFRPKAGGREINGKTYDQYPKISNVESVLNQVVYDEKAFAKFSKRKTKQKMHQVVKI
ncbi:MAG: phage Gp37/Gp68 family protein [Nitrosopumilaceae archaeon]|nr:phage Gp37/Gp68 family protein [Nitrosopumilaceae archaeon]